MSFTDPLLENEARDIQALRRLLVLMKHAAPAWEPKVTAEIADGFTPSEKLKALVCACVLEQMALKGRSKQERKLVFDWLFSGEVPEVFTMDQARLINQFCLLHTRIEILLKSYCDTHCQHCGHRTSKDGLRCHICRRWLGTDATP